MSLLLGGLNEFVFINRLEQCLAHWRCRVLRKPERRFQQKHRRLRGWGWVSPQEGR